MQRARRSSFSLIKETVSHKDSVMWFNKYMFSVYVIVALLVAACASSKGTTYNYLCSDGNRFQVTMTHNGEKVILRLGERLLELPHVRSASGAKYSDGETTFWSKGIQAFITTHDKVSHKDCVIEK